MKGRVAAGFCPYQATAHQTELVSSNELSLQTADWLEQTPAATRPFVE